MAPEPVVSSSNIPSSPTLLANDVYTVNFIARVSSLPIVNSALQSAKTLYDSSKSKYQLIDTIETSVKTKVVPQFQPIVQTFHAYGDAQLAQIDSYACTGLDLLETQLPIIKEPTTKVIETTKALVDNALVNPVKNVTTQVTTKALTVVETGKHTVEEGLKSQYVSGVFTFTEGLADRFLGPDEAAAAAISANGQGVVTFETIQQLGTSVGTRLFKQAHLPPVTLPSSADLKNLVAISELVKYSNQLLTEQLAWLEKTFAASQKQVASEHQAIATQVTHVTQLLVNTLTTTSTTLATYLPESVHVHTSRLHALLQEQLSHLHHLQLNKDSFFFQKLNETATTGQKYLDLVTAQLTQLYAQGKSYTLTPSASPALASAVIQPEEQIVQ